MFILSSTLVKIYYTFYLYTGKGRQSPVARPYKQMNLTKAKFFPLQKYPPFRFVLIWQVSPILLWFSDDVTLLFTILTCVFCDHLSVSKSITQSISVYIHGILHRRTNTNSSVLRSLFSHVFSS